jgi:flagella basal body P-ring formation protein FlgA
MRNKITVVSLFLLLLIMSTGVLAVNNRIVIPNKVKVREVDVKLGDIASINGDSTFQNKVKNIILGQAPLPGYQRIIYRDEVIYALRALKINLTQVNLNIPYQFTVVSDYKELSINSLIDLGKDYIYNSLPYNQEEIKVDVINPPQDLMVPYGDLKLEIGEFYQGNLVGTTTIPIEIVIEDEVYRRVYIQYKVGVLQKVFVAKGPIQKDQLISGDLFEVEERLINTLNHQFIDINTDLNGKRMKIPLDMGRPLLKSMVEMPPLVERWKEITIIARVGGVEVTTTGKSLQQGHLGDTIKVQNINSRETIKARVIAKDTVEVLIN